MPLKGSIAALDQEFLDKTLFAHRYSLEHDWCVLRRIEEDISEIVDRL